MKLFLLVSNYNHCCQIDTLIIDEQSLQGLTLMPENPYNTKL